MMRRRHPANSVAAAHSRSCQEMGKGGGCVDVQCSGSQHVVEVTTKTKWHGDTRNNTTSIFRRTFVVPLQIIGGSLILGIILILAPLVYAASYLWYSGYVIQRERVIRGFQPKDNVSASQVEAFGTTSKDFVERELINHSGTYKIKCDVKIVTEEKDIIETINFARENGLNIRAMGSLFSWPNVLEPSKKRGGIVLDMKYYNQMIEVSALPETDTQSDGTVALVKVQSGMKVWQLCNLLESLGYALPVLGNVTGQSVGGVVSTGSHGKNKRFGSLSSLMQSMQLVCANGEIKNIGIRGESGKFLTDTYACAAGVSMGLLGVISTVTLRVVPKHRLSYSIQTMPFETFINSYDEILDSAEHVCFIYFPYVDRVKVELSKTLTLEEETNLKDKTMPTYNRTQLFFVTIFNYVIYESVFGNLFGPIVWLVTRYINCPGLEHEASVSSPAIDKSFKVVAMNVDLDIEHHEMEYGYDASIAKEVILAYRDVFQSLPVYFQYSSCLDIRFSAGDAAWLAASSGRPTMWLDLIRPNVHTRTEFFMNCFKSAIIKYGGRPHFGKENILGSSQLQKCFPHYSEFVKIRDELDPDRLFANPYYDSLFSSES